MTLCKWTGSYMLTYNTHLIFCGLRFDVFEDMTAFEYADVALYT